jgi:uncharacterized protein DUF4326
MPERVVIVRGRSADGTGRKLPPNTVWCARPGRWGNPFVIGETAPADLLGAKVFVRDREHAVDLYRQLLRARPLTVGMIRHDLAGKNTACYCKLDQVCHADVILAVAAGEDP